MINSRAFLRFINSPSRKNCAPLYTARTFQSCKAYRQLPFSAAIPIFGPEVSARDSTLAGLSCSSASKMNPSPPTRAGDTSSTAAGLPLTDEQIATHIPATVEDYSFPTDRLRTLNDSTKTPLVLMACGSCKCYVVGVQPCTTLYIYTSS